ncbi:MAG TPA: VCBS repeat-containing protein, partial [Gemmatimonadaceae bacterium]|nr:VCBS repeat-containing protein [Gemmatimonadaceae bacterium]
ASDLRQAQVREADTFSSAIAINNGNGTFTLKPLPAEAQFAPIYASVAADFDGDGKTDLLVAGNFFDVTPMLGGYDASYGLLLRGDGQGSFTAVDGQASGLAIDGQVRDMKLIRTPKGQLIAVARNNDQVMMLRVGATALKPSPKSRSAKPGT